MQERDLVPSLSTPPWEPVATWPVLAADEVHVWRAEYLTVDRRREAFARLISAEEQERANRFRFAKDQVGYVLWHGLLRRLLQHYTGIPAREIRYVRAEHGKPELPPPATGMPLRFNHSDSEDYALFAFTRLGPVGVDLEYMRPEVARETIPENYFTPGECAALRALPDSVQPQAFYSCWTRKEAFLKARGEGITRGLAHFEVSLTPGEPARLLAVEASSEKAQGWVMADLVPGPGYAGAMVVQAAGCRVCCWDWQNALLECDRVGS